MKKYTLLLCIFSLIYFSAHASNSDRENFINNDLTRDDINMHYNGFIEHTNDQVKKFNSTGAKIASYLVNIFTFGQVSKDDAINELAMVLGYNEASRRLLCIGKLILDAQWKNRLDYVIFNCSDEDIIYVNKTKNYVLQNMYNQYNTHNALNETMQLIHQCHIEELQKMENFDNNYANVLRNNSEKINNEYPMYSHLVEYKNNHNDELPRTITWNMFLAYLFALHKITTKGS